MPELSASDPDFAAGMRRDADRRDRLGGSVATAERVRSRTRFRDAAKAEALDVGLQAFPDEFSGRLFDGREPTPGLRVVRSLGARSALVQDSAGRRSVVQSSTPLETPNAGGITEPVDLSLVETSSSFTSVNPLTRVRIAKRVRDGISFADGKFAITPVSDGDVSGARTSDRVFFANTQRDSDVVVAPRAGGAEVAWQLRSSASPENVTFNVDLSAGAVLRRARSEHPIPGDPPQAIEIANGDTALGYVYPPNAYDADGQPIRSSARIDGSQIVIHVDHRNAEIRYPVFVDPEVIIPGAYMPGAAPSGFEGWLHAQNPSPASPGYDYYGVAANDCAYYCGLYLSMPTHTWYDKIGTGVNWYFTAPANTYIYRAAYGNMAHTPLYDARGYTYSRWYQGLFGSAGWESGVQYINQSGGYGPNPFGPSGQAASAVGRDYCFGTPPSSCDRTRGSEQNQALFGLAAQNDYSNTAIYTGEAKARLTMESAAIFLGDRHPPTIVPMADSTWSSNPNRTAAIDASDLGLGLYSYTLSGASTGNTTVTRSCGDYYRSRCSAHDSQPFNYTVPEGTTTITAHVEDVVGNSDTKTHNERLDTQPPALTLTGDLWTDRSTKTFPDGGQLHIAATDGDTASLSTQRSGVKTIVVKVDGEASDQALTQDCIPAAASCAGTMDYVFDTVDYAPGVHEISVIATDQAGNPSSPQTWNITVSAAGPNSKMSYSDTGSDDGTDLAPVDDQSTACPPDPEAGPDGQYCNADDASNEADIRERASAASTSTTMLCPNCPGWGISDNNDLSATVRDQTNPTINMFTDPLFTATNIKTVRRIVPWDVVTRGNTPRANSMNYPACRQGNVALQGNELTPDPTDTRALSGDQTQDLNGDGDTADVGERSDLDVLREWMSAAKTAGMTVMVSFEHSRPTASECYLPTRPQYRAAVKAFRDEFPYVSLYTSWNEPNNKTQPTQHRFDVPSHLYAGYRQAGRFWLDLKQECKRKDPQHAGGPLVTCTVGAGEFQDDHSMDKRPYSLKSSGKETFRQYVIGLNGQEPSVWAWHAYSAGYLGRLQTMNGQQRSQFRSTIRLAKFIAALHYTDKASPTIWLTEQGGRYDQHVNTVYDNKPAEEAAALANDDLAYLLNLPFVPETGNRITRMLIYSWLGAPATAPNPFDSGLLDVNSPTKAPRAMYNTFKNKVTGATG